MQSNVEAGLVDTNDTDLTLLAFSLPCCVMTLFQLTRSLMLRWLWLFRVNSLEWPSAAIGGDLAPSLGGEKKFRRPRFQNYVLVGKNSHFHAQNFKISHDLFLVIDHDFRIFHIFFYIFHIFSACNVIYDPFSTRKTPISGNNSLYDTFLLLCSCFRTHPTNTTFQNIGRTDAWAVPHLNFFGIRPPSPP